MHGEGGPDPGDGVGHVPCADVLSFRGLGAANASAETTSPSGGTWASIASASPTLSSTQTKAVRPPKEQRPTQALDRTPNLVWAEDGAASWGVARCAVETRVAYGDELRLEYKAGSKEWSSTGHIIKIPNSTKGGVNGHADLTWRRFLTEEEGGGGRRQSARV